MQPLPSLAWVALALLVATGARASELDVAGGALVLDHANLQADQLTVAAPARLEGMGELNGALTVAGTLSPGVGPAPDIGILAVTGPVAFAAGSAFEGHAATHTALDRLIAGGAVTGSCAVVMSKHPSAIPLGQVIVDGAAGSDYVGFYPAGPTATNWQLAEVPVGNLAITDLYGDTDGDGIPDWWENAYFAGRTNSDARADFDGDRAVDLYEYIAGTVPTNASSYLGILSLQPVAGVDYVLSWSSASNRTYVLESLTNLAGVVVSAVSNLSARPPENTYTSSLPTLQPCFFRIRVQTE